MVREDGIGARRQAHRLLALATLAVLAEPAAASDFSGLAWVMIGAVALVSLLFIPIVWVAAAPIRIRPVRYAMRALAISILWGPTPTLGGELWWPASLLLVMGDADDQRSAGIAIAVSTVALTAIALIVTMKPRTPPVDEGPTDELGAGDEQR